MCQTTPIQIKEIKNNAATLADGRLVDISLIKKAKAGDWILANANLAIEKISAKDAKEILKLLNKKHSNILENVGI